MLDRAKYLTLVLLLYAALVAIIVAIVATLLDRTLLQQTINLAPAIILGLIGMIVHALRHDLHPEDHADLGPDDTDGDAAEGPSAPSGAAGDTAEADERR